MLGDAVDHRVTDLEDAHPVGPEHGDGIDDEGDHTQRHHRDQPAGQRLRTGVQSPQEGDHERQGDALQNSGGHKPADDDTHLGGVDDTNHELPHGHSSFAAAERARSWFRHMVA